MAYACLSVDLRQRIATITIDRPHQLNALNYQTLEELRDVLTGIKNDPEAKVILVTGRGEKAFVAGADLHELALLDPIGGKEVAEKGQDLFLFIERLGKPIIGVVNGIALGGGLELALACTMRVASPNARFGLPEVGLGIIPGYGGTQRLSRLVGKGRAMEMILSAEPIDAQEAYRIGLINKIFPKESLLEEASNFAQHFAAKGSMALRLAMEAVHEGSDLPLEQALRLESSLAGLSWATEDAKEGTKAFLEKRRPVFKDH